MERGIRTVARKRTRKNEAASAPAQDTRGVATAEASASALASEAKYVYCIIESKKAQSFGKVGVGGRGDEVYAIIHGDLAAVVSDTAIAIHDPTRENVLGHERVIEAVMEQHSVLPMSFGTVFRTKDDVIAFLTDTHDALRDVIGQVRDKIEFGVQVNWDRDAVVRDIEAQSDEVARLKTQIQRATSGSTYFARVQLGRLVERLLSERADNYVREIYDTLRADAVASKLNKPIGERMILNAAFLVERGHAERFDRRMHEVARRYEGRLAFRYTGPWPPYNFVNVRLTLQQSGARA
ncbi:MAG: hypothetical protein AUH85_12450 [Chloroflexi bacterium 13_1_40CM_4_68_4]|nr:MAG: hypothetical protein AUH85_12450 [Chloroflexi bacterium 13_1_40CM_4_68_4]